MLIHGCVPGKPIPIWSGAERLHLESARRSGIFTVFTIEEHCMKADMFLKLAPIKGDCVDARHKDEIELSGMNWGISLPAAPASSRGGMGRAEIQEIVLRKRVDAASPALHAHCCCGTAFAEAIIVKRKSGLVPLEYFKMTLKEVFISSIELQIGGGDDSDDEVIRLRFTEFVEEFVPQKQDGSGGGSVTHGYNITKGTKI